MHIASQAPDPQQAVDALIREANRRWLAEEEVRWLLLVKWMMGEVREGKVSTKGAVPP